MGSVISMHAGCEGTTEVIKYSVSCVGRSLNVYVPMTSLKIKGDPGVAEISTVRGKGESVIMVSISGVLSQV